MQTVKSCVTTQSRYLKRHWASVLLPEHSDSYSNAGRSAGKSISNAAIMICKMKKGRRMRIMTHECATFLFKHHSTNKLPRRSNQKSLCEKRVQISLECKTLIPEIRRLPFSTSCARENTSARRRCRVSRPICFEFNDFMTRNISLLKMTKTGR